MAGAPAGNQNGSKGRKATNALVRAIDIRDNKANWPLSKSYGVLVDIWNKQIDLALEGDKTSAQMIIERLDGKPKQAVVGGDEDDSPIQFKIVRKIVRPGDKDS